MKRDRPMSIDIIIDKLTDCLVLRETNAFVKTEYMKLDTSIPKKAYSKWKFKWNETQKNGYDIYELFVVGDPDVQGRISLKIDGGVADVDIVESNPYNIGKQGKYIGVGGHLFAIACKISMDNNCDGFVAFTAKTNLIQHYTEMLGAKLISGQRMYIDDIAAKKLIDRYLER